MTTLEALVSMSQMVLRARGEWFVNGATSYADIRAAVRGVAEIMNREPHCFGGELAPPALIEMAFSELVRRQRLYDDVA